jgi:hypothetical protein
MARGIAAAQAAMIGALYVFLLQAPLQVVSMLSQDRQWAGVGAAGQQPDTKQLVLSVSLSCGAFVLSLAVFFLFPLVQGGILGQARDQLESPDQPPGRFGAYARAFYSRLLGNEALATLLMFVVMVPAMGLFVGYAFLELAQAAELSDPQELTPLLLSRPAVLVAMGALALLLSAVGIVYWVANCIVVSEVERVGASWRRSLHFCRRNFAAVLVVWLVNVVAGLLISPIGLVSAWGIVKEPWALVAVALVYSAVIACWSVLLAGLVMSLYLAGRSRAEQREPETSAMT